MKLWHFTSPHHVEGCRRYGLRLGMVPVSLDPPRLLRGYQWLTSNPDRAQSWTEGSTLPYDRTAFRLTIRIPRSHRGHVRRWTEVGPLLVAADTLATLNEFGDPENWWLYVGAVPPRWIERVVDMRGGAVPA